MFSKINICPLSLGGQYVVGFVEVGVANKILNSKTGCWFYLCMNLFFKDFFLEIFMENRSISSK